VVHRCKIAKLPELKEGGVMNVILCLLSV